MTGDLTINGKDAYTTWGVFLEDGALSALMTPAPLKSFIENSVAGEHGKQIFAQNPKVDERTISMAVCIKADTETQFMIRYKAFVTELQSGILEIKTKYEPDVVYRCTYLSCQQFSQFVRRLGKFVLRLSEPNPMNRSIS